MRSQHRSAAARHAVLLSLTLCAGLAQGANHDNVQTRAECAAAASAALGEHALIFEDPPQASPPRPTDMAAEYYWRALLVGGGKTPLPVWLHCELVPGSTATHAEVLRRDPTP